MRSLAEPIARMANKQDNCTGRFWEGRFKAQRIVDEAGLLACAMYVDLNPVRAAMTESPDKAQHTSAFDRIHGEQGEQIDSAAFDLRPVEREQSAKEIRNTPVDELTQTAEVSTSQSDWEAYPPRRLAGTYDDAAQESCRGTSGTP